MKKCLRFLWKVLLTVLVIIAVLLAVILCGGLGPLVKWCVPPIAKHMGADVAIERCVILPLGGYVCLEGLRVENPKRFREQNAEVYAEKPLAKLGKLEVDVGMRTLFKDEIVVDKVELTGIRALYAFDFDTTNVDALLDEMGLKPDTSAEGTTTEEEVVTTEEPEAEPKDTASQKKVRIAYLHIEDNSVTMRKFVNIPVALPPLTLENKDSASVIDSVRSTVEPVINVFKGAGQMVGDGVGVVSDAIAPGVELLGDGVSKTTEVLGDGAKAVGDGVKALGDGVMNLFK